MTEPRRWDISAWAGQVEPLPVIAVAPEDREAVEAALRSVLLTALPPELAQRLARKQFDKLAGGGDD